MRTDVESLVALGDVGPEVNRLVDANPTDARFFARADNLNFYLATVEKRLGNLSQRLSASAHLPLLLERTAPSGATEETPQPAGTARSAGGVVHVQAAADDR